MLYDARERGDRLASSVGRPRKRKAPSWTVPLGAFGCGEMLEKIVAMDFVGDVIKYIPVVRRRARLDETPVKKSIQGATERRKHAVDAGYVVGTQNKNGWRRFHTRSLPKVSQMSSLAAERTCSAVTKACFSSDAARRLPDCALARKSGQIKLRCADAILIFVLTGSLQSRVT